MSTNKPRDGRIIRGDEESDLSDVILAKWHDEYPDRLLIFAAAGNPDAWLLSDYSVEVSG